jgi:hypothetical protein
MEIHRDPTRTGPRPGPPYDTPEALPTLLRGEEVLEEARDVAQRISGRVSRAVTGRSPPDERTKDRQ